MWTRAQKLKLQNRKMKNKWVNFDDKKWTVGWDGPQKC